MEQQQKFLALSRSERFGFLYYAVRENEKFIIDWIRNDYPGDASTKEDYQESVQNAFDFLGKLILPGLKEEIVLTKELMLNGLADDLLSFSEEVAEMHKISNSSRAATVLAAIESLYTCLIDCFFSPERYDEENCPFHVILLSAIGNQMDKNYDKVKAEKTWGTSWSDLDKSFQSFSSLITAFMDNVFLKTGFTALILNS